MTPPYERGHLDYKLIAFFTANPAVELTLRDILRKWYDAKDETLRRKSIPEYDRVHKTLKVLLDTGWLSRKRDTHDRCLWAYSAGPRLEAEL